MREDDLIEWFNLDRFEDELLGCCADWWPNSGYEEDKVLYRYPEYVVGTDRIQLPDQEEVVYAKESQRITDEEMAETNRILEQEKAERKQRREEKERIRQLRETKRRIKAEIEAAKAEKLRQRMWEAEERRRQRYKDYTWRYEFEDEPCLGYKTVFIACMRYKRRWWSICVYHGARMLQKWKQDILGANDPRRLLGPVERFSSLSVEKAQSRVLMLTKNQVVFGKSQ